MSEETDFTEPGRAATKGGEDSLNSDEVSSSGTPESDVSRILRRTFILAAMYQLV